MQANFIWAAKYFVGSEEFTKVKIEYIPWRVAGKLQCFSTLINLRKTILFTFSIFYLFT